MNSEDPAAEPFHHPTRHELEWPQVKPGDIVVSIWDHRIRAHGEFVGFDHRHDVDGALVHFPYRDWPTWHPLSSLRPVKGRARRRLARLWMWIRW